MPFQLGEAELFDANKDCETHGEGEGQPCECCAAQVGSVDPASDQGEEMPFAGARDIYCRLAHAGPWGFLTWKDLLITELLSMYCKQRSNYLDKTTIVPGGPAVIAPP